MCLGKRGGRFAIFDNLFAPFEIRVKNELLQALTLSGREVRGHIRQDIARVLLRGEEHRIWSSIECVRDLEWF